MTRRPYTPWGTPDEPPDDAEREPDASPLVTRLRALAAAERAADARDGDCLACGGTGVGPDPGPCDSCQGGAQ